MKPHEEKITLAGGCFWCIESAFNQVQGVLSAISGYMGGDPAVATYQAVSSGITEHAEVVELTFDKSQITCREILEIFFTLHDASQLNRQGNDIGSQYRSGVFYHNEEQKITALNLMEEINISDMYESKVVTEVTASTAFFTGEKVHQNYFKNNSESRYCQVIISPKLAKFRKTFVDKLKPICA
jgi:peptide-methionine (S)-S-oxide reductase